MIFGKHQSQEGNHSNWSSFQVWINFIDLDRVVTELTHAKELDVAAEKILCELANGVGTLMKIKSISPISLPSPTDVFY